MGVIIINVKYRVKGINRKKIIRSVLESVELEFYGPNRPRKYRTVRPGNQRRKEGFSGKDSNHGKELVGASLESDSMPLT